MERPRIEIDEYVRRLEHRRLDVIASIEAARDPHSLASREMVFRPARRALGALWRTVTAHADMPSRESRVRSSS